MQLLHQRLSLANTLSPCNWRRSVVSKRVLTVLQIIKTVIFLFAAVSTGWAIVFLMEEERRPRSFERAVQTGPTDWTDAKKKKTNPSQEESWKENHVIKNWTNSIKIALPPHFEKRNFA